jgi:hypothetical protein
MKIAIKFGDNDFYNCFTGVLKTLLEAYKWNDKLPVKKDELCIIINEISYGCYLAFQNQFSYNEEKTGEICQRTKDYLKIKPEQILINEEVVAYLKSDAFMNSETFILDTDLDYPGNNPVYTS